MLDRAGRLTPGSLRAAIARAVMEAAPDKAQEAAGDRGEVRAGGAVGRGFRQRRAGGPGAAAGPGAGGGRADHRLGRELKAGRAGRRHGRAPRPRLPGPAPGPGLPPRPGPPPSVPGAAPAGFASRVTLTVPLATLTGLAAGPASSPASARSTPGWPATSPRRRAQPQDHLVRDRHRPAGPRRRPRLRPARTQESQANAPAPARRRVPLHPGQPGRPARRVRHLAAAHPRTRART